MDSLLRIYQYSQISNITDDKFIESLIGFLSKNSASDSIFLEGLMQFFVENNEVNYLKILEMIGLVYQKKKEKITISQTNERKHNGIYYTKYEIAELIIKQIFSSFKNADPDYFSISFLEPCAGTGIFIVAYIDHLINKLKPNLDSQTLQKIINNIYFADIDGEAVKLLMKIIPLYVKAKYSFDICFNDRNSYVGDALFNFGGKISKNNLATYFGKESGFDIVVTNPPYKLLKANSNKYEKGKSNGYHEVLNEILSYIKMKNVYKYNNGTLNLYKLFVEEILENYTTQKSKVGLLVPITLLKDHQSSALRSMIINRYSISTIYTIPEKNNFFPEISQSFCFFTLDKSRNNKLINIVSDVVSSEDFSRGPVIVDKDEIDKISNSKEIIVENKQGWDILLKIHQNPKLSSFLSVKNLRGELDLTLDKTFITTSETRYSLIKGDNLKEFSFSKDKNFVKPEFLEKIKNKKAYIESERIVCQQISNIHQEKRLKFSKIGRNFILGNSCNFITLENGGSLKEKKLSLDYLLGILNSLLPNWRFKLTSSNNHVGNYELAELPIAVPDRSGLETVEKLVKGLNKNPNDIGKLAQLNFTVFKLYGLTRSQAEFILSKYRDTQLIGLIKGKIREYGL